MRILLTGSKGQLAHCFRDRLPENWELIATDSSSLNITDFDAVRNMVDSFQPDAIVNTAAYTAVDKAESEAALAFSVNASAVHNLAAAAHASHARFVHISTDYVFDGQSKSPYREFDYANPQSVYGRSKLAGELLALADYPESLILRTSWLFSEYGRNFVKTMMASAADRRELSVINDQTGNPTYAGDLADALILILRDAPSARGIYHYCGNKSVNWLEFAQTVFAAAEQKIEGFQPPAVSGIESADYAVSAARPLYSVLDCHKIERELGISPSDWTKALTEIITKI